MSRDLDHVLAAIDGALADDDLPDAMRWSPEPAQVTDAGRYVYAEAEGPLVEVVFAMTAAQRAARDRQLLREEADRERARADRVRGRRHPTPRGPAPDGQLMLDHPLIVSGLAVRAAADHDAAMARLRQVFTVDPEQVARMDDLTRAFGLAAQQAAEQIGKAFATLADLLSPQLVALRSAGVLPDPGPADPRERALWLRQHRNTGPQVPYAQAAHRPRRHR